MRCTICEKEFDPEGSRSLPFCSERCRRIDLGRWLDERYGLPYESLDDPEETAEE
jgi:endogenous inhibitor of DNA gyrase (YacG/DUF329 family)